VDGLALEGLTKRYGDRVALDDLSFAVPPGTMFGFVGPNGAGKTTTMRIVLGVLAADSGRVAWQGEELDVDARRAIGYMPEERGLYPKMKVREQVVFFARLHALKREEAERATDSWLERLGIADRAEDKVEKLSLGNQQRVQLAVALVHDPVLLVLDEPFSGVDPVGVDVLSEVLAERARVGVPVVFSSHQLELVERLCDAVAIVADGRLVASGEVEELREKRGGRRLEVEVGGGDPSWARGVSGVRAVEADGALVSLELEEGADEQAVLDAARRAGRVERFGWARPSLTDLFREAVEDTAASRGAVAGTAASTGAGVE
jgi:ABC-2 type transport system ATP-binding protein